MRRENLIWPQKVKRGVCYWPTFGAAQRIADYVRETYPHVRVVGYALGYALQVQKSGDYLGADLKPSLERAA